MLRGLIAVFIAFTITIAGIAKPAYAYSGALNMTSVSPIEIQENGNSIYTGDFSKAQAYEEPKETSNSVIKALRDGALGMIGGILVCYTLDAAATTVFPPAAALAAYCPSLGASSGGAKAVFEGAKAVAGAH